MLTCDAARMGRDLQDYGELLRHHGEAPVAVRRCETVEEVLKESDVSDARKRKAAHAAAGAAAAKCAHAA